MLEADSTHGHTAAATSQHVSDLSMDACLWAHSHFSNLYLALARGLFFGPCEGAHLGPAKGLSLQWFS